MSRMSSTTACSQSLAVVVLCLFQIATCYLIDAPCREIQGTLVTAPNNMSYIAFRNIPYAKPPVGELRFALPVPLGKMEGTYDARSEKIIKCPQPIMWTTDEPGQEDCLILNVYIPKAKGLKRKVMVYIHGGGFVLGSSKNFEAGDLVTNQGIILVTINYRVGVLGFLSMENKAGPGNLGLWDQNMALKWVKDNIEAFGGDPDDITLAGESAGGVSVTFHCISPYSKDLFTKAYIHSGAATGIYSKALTPQEDALAFARSQGCWEGEPDVYVTLEEAESQRVLDCLRKVPVVEFTKVSDFGMAGPKFVPYTDKNFIPNFVSTLLKVPEYLKSIGFFDKKYLFAVNENEYSAFGLGVTMMKEFIRKDLAHNSEEDKEMAVQDFLESVFNFYVKSRFHPRPVNDDIKLKILDWYKRRSVDYVPEIVTDLNFLIPTYDFLDVLTKNKTTNSWFLQFNHYPGFLKGNKRGSVHGVDLLYWTDMKASTMEPFLRAGIQGELDDVDFALKETFSSLIGEFVKSGYLTNSMKNKISGIWPIYEPTEGIYLDFSPNARVKRQLDIEKKDVWHKTAPEWVLRQKPVKSRVKHDEF